MGLAFFSLCISRGVAALVDKIRVSTKGQNIELGNINFFLFSENGHVIDIKKSFLFLECQNLRNILEKKVMS